eukprot:1140003-Rhodomonas_salina.2
MTSLAFNTRSSNKYKLHRRRTFSCLTSQCCQRRAWRAGHGAARRQIAYISKSNTRHRIAGANGTEKAGSCV